MLRIQHPDGSAESFTYNPLGQALTHTDGKGETPGQSSLYIYESGSCAPLARVYGQAPDLSKLNADHPVDLIVGGSATQRLQMLNETINKSVGSALKNAGRKAGLQPGDKISAIVFN